MQCLVMMWYALFPFQHIPQIYCGSQRIYSRIVFQIFEYAVYIYYFNILHWHMMFVLCVTLLRILETKFACIPLFEPQHTAIAGVVCARNTLQPTFMKKRSGQESMFVTTAYIRCSSFDLCSPMQPRCADRALETSKHSALSSTQFSGPSRATPSTTR